jgi:hypothetical protein
MVVFYVQVDIKLICLIHHPNHYHYLAIDLDSEEVGNIATNPLNLPIPQMPFLLAPVPSLPNLQNTAIRAISAAPASPLSAPALPDEVDPEADKLWTRHAVEEFIRAVNKHGKNWGKVLHHMHSVRHFSINYFTCTQAYSLLNL